jgi:hypothetical protein
MFVGNIKIIARWRDVNNGENPALEFYKKSGFLVRWK